MTRVKTASYQPLVTSTRSFHPGYTTKTLYPASPHPQGRASLSTQVADTSFGASLFNAGVTAATSFPAGWVYSSPDNLCPLPTLPPVPSFTSFTPGHSHTPHHHFQQPHPSFCLHYLHNPPWPPVTPWCQLGSAQVAKAIAFLSWGSQPSGSAPCRHTPCTAPFFYIFPETTRQNSHRTN